MEAVLDSSFILSCARRKIDFVEELEEKGFKIVVPREVVQELKDLRLNVTRDEKVNIELALAIIDSSKKIKKAGFKEGKVDEQLIQKGKQGVYIATLDKAIKREVPNRIVISNATNKIDIERD